MWGNLFYLVIGMRRLQVMGNKPKWTSRLKYLAQPCFFLEDW